ncbi:MAG: tRNA(Ile)(2)-agmatinylcytidine synthase [Candidatus Thermoplasmatota archaeon]|nr:tRNA(Ile)(2)-agmatinylcytidine synthase [Candidatus Thermoplasmatota archaeon]
MIEYHLGIDSTDSLKLGMCTTYLGARIIEALAGMGCEFERSPDLVRLNPNIPWKTRGNGAVCIRMMHAEGGAEEIMRVAQGLTDKLSVLEDEQANPGIALVTGSVPEELKDLYIKAVHEVVEIEYAISVGELCGALMKGYKNRRGLIGALSAIGAMDMPNWTWETMAYRDPYSRTRERMVDPSSIASLSLRYPSTFFNIDGSGKPLCIPHSPCPVMFGIRGTDAVDSLKAASEVACSGMERWVLWRTNQHTDAHIETVENIDYLKELSSVRMKGGVARRPSYHPGGHLSFSLEDGRNHTIDCWAYEPTKDFRKRLRGLIEGDVVEVWGGIRAEEDGMPACINLEKVLVIELVQLMKRTNPHCPECKGPTESMGRGQSLRCKACGFRNGTLHPVLRPVERDLCTGFIDPPEVAWRHLYRPSWLEFSKEPTKTPASFWGRGPLSPITGGMISVRSERSNREQGVKKRGLNA